MGTPDIEVSLNAVIIAVTDGAPRVLTVPGPDGLPALPTGLLQPQDRTLDTALRRWVRDQTEIEVGYVEQLYTFGDRARTLAQPSSTSSPADAAARPTGSGPRMLSIAYLALVPEGQPAPSASWRNIYDFLPWEDHRLGRPSLIEERLSPGLTHFCDTAPAQDTEERRQRSQILFGLGDVAYDNVRVLERYELLFEAGLFEAGSVDGHRPSNEMALDHRRIVATAFGRLRGKITYRPVVFELLADTFTLLQLQRMVESLAGVPLHKQNFRRLVESAGLVEGTGDQAHTGGRPAELFRFRREVLRERPRPGVGAHQGPI